MKSSSVEELAANLHRLLADAEALLRDSAEGASEALRRTCTHLRTAGEDLTNKTRNVDQAVHAHPWWALTATAIVAFIAGLSVRRR
jgi:ElaB/YqjD/DUF883 family membrane-anchored ribosome-binding protein